MFLSIIMVATIQNSLSQCLTSIKNQSYDGKDVEIVYVMMDLKIFNKYF